MVASMWIEGSLALGLRGVWVSLLSTCGIRLNVRYILHVSIATYRNDKKRSFGLSSCMNQWGNHSCNGRKYNFIDACPVKTKS